MSRSSGRVRRLALAVLMIATVLGTALLALGSASTEAANQTSTTGVTVVRIPGVSFGSAHSVAPNGWVVGTGPVAGSGLGQGPSAWIWRGSGTGDAERITPNYISTGVITNAIATDVNSSGQVVGWYDHPSFNGDRAFKWSAPTGFESLGLSPTSSGASSGAGITEGGLTVGFRTTGPLGSFRGGFSDPLVDFETIDNFRATDISSAGASGVGSTWIGDGLVSLDPGASHTASIGYAIDDGGEVVGAVLNAGGANQAAYWASPGSPPVLIGTLGGTTSTASGINSSGVVVGSSQTATGETHGFVWTAAEGMRDLGTLGGNHSEAVGINDSGLIAGAAQDAFGATVPVVWDISGAFDPDLPPVVEPIGQQEAYADTTLTIAPTVSDPEGDPWEVAWSAHGLEFPDGGPFIPTTGFPAGAEQIGDSLVWTPSTSTPEGAYLVRVTATQVGSPGHSTSQLVSIILPGGNRAPVIEPVDDQVVVVGSELLVNVTATDPEGHPFSFSLSFGTPESPIAPPGGATIDPQSGVFSWTPSEDDIGSHEVTVYASEDPGDPRRPALTSHVTFTVEVTPDIPPLEIVIHEQVGVRDMVRVTGPVVIVVAERVEVSDTTSVTPPLRIVVSEHVDVSDATTAIPPLTILVEERIDASDAAEVMRPLLIVVSEQVKVLDTSSVMPPLTIMVNERVEVLDVVRATPPILIMVAERVEISDRVTVHGPVHIQVFERVSVVDVVEVVGTGGGDDGDGIAAEIDGFIEDGSFVSEAAVYSDSFTDEHLGGSTFGRVLDRAGNTVDLSDAGAPQGINFETGSVPADVIIEWCAAGFVLLLPPDSSGTVTCGSVTVSVVEGSARIVLADGISATVPAGATATITEQDGGWLVQADSGGPLTILIGDETEELAEGQSRFIGTVPSLDLHVAASRDPVPAQTSDALEVMFTVTNDGAVAVSGLELTIRTPGGIELGSVDPSEGECSTRGRSVTCALEALSPDQNLTVTLGVGTRGRNSLTFSGTVTAAGLDPRHASLTVRVCRQDCPPP